MEVYLTAELSQRVSELESGSGKGRGGGGGVSFGVSGVQRVQPGEIVSGEVGYLRGHGTYEKTAEGEGEPAVLYAAVNGIVERVNKLVSVKPLNSRYGGEVGDVVVGRITDVLQRSWKVDINSRQEGMLQLSAIYLPGGAQRRRTASDELQMRSFFSEHDVISAEVQQVYSEGGAALHTRSMKYGKLCNGQLVTVPASLVKRVKNHFFSFPFGVDMIMGTNGMIWLAAGGTLEESAAAAAEGLPLQDSKAVPIEVREKIARTRNAIEALSTLHISIYPDTIKETFNTSLELQVAVKDMLKPGRIHQITKKARFSQT